MEFCTIFILYFDPKNLLHFVPKKFFLLVVLSTYYPFKGFAPNSAPRISTCYFFLPVRIIPPAKSCGTFPVQSTVPEPRAPGREGEGDAEELVEEETALAVDAYLLEPRPRLGMPPGRGQGCEEGRVTPGREGLSKNSPPCGGPGPPFPPLSPGGSFFFSWDFIFIFLFDC